MSFLKLIPLFLVLFCLPENHVAGERILCVLPTWSRSHLIVIQALMIGLAERGHEVTMISSYPPEKPIKNFHQINIAISDDYRSMVKSFVDNAGDKFHMLRAIQYFTERSMEIVDVTFQSREVQDLMINGQFDLVFVEGIMGDSFLGFGAHFKCPIIVFSSAFTVVPLNELVGNPYSVSSVPNMMMGYTEPMTFKQRVYNFLAVLAEKYIAIKMTSAQSKYYERYFPSPKYPTFDDMKQNVSLVFLGTHFSQGNVRPYVPAMIELGGIQIKQQPDPLPKDIQDFMDGAKDGVIYFSMGSNLVSSDFPAEKQEAFLKTFSKLKQRILWKFEDNSFKDLPKNVKIGKWLPQDDVLAHPNLRMFVTHGGLGSMTESKFHGVPVVGIPIFGDQMSNIENAVNEGWAVSVEYSDLTEERLSSAVNEVLINSSYSKTVKRWSKLYRDRPISAMETGVFWTEYVMRHHGAKHMQSYAIYLNLWQKNSVDVVGFLLAIVFALLLIILLLFRCIFKFICRKKVIVNNGKKKL